MQRDIKMLARQHGLCTWHDHDRLGIINDHRRTHHHIPSIQVIKQEHRRIIHTPNFVKVDTPPSLKLGLVLDMSRFQLGNLGVNRIAEGVECFSYTTDLFMKKKKEYGQYKSSSSPKCRRKKYLDIIHNDTLRIQQKPELRFIHPLEGLLKVLPFPVLRCRQYHQRRICTLKTHV